jgi:predicted RNase H-like nuclease
MLMGLEGRGVGFQAYAIVGKIRQVDGLMTPELQGRVVEVHPELCFYGLNHGMPVFESKRSLAGFEMRRGLLGSVLPGFAHLIDARLRSKAAPDDILDALAAAWTARRVAEDTADWIPDDPEKDAKGLRMEMWF